MEEMNTIKDDLQFILDNNKNSKSLIKMKTKERDRDIDKDIDKDIDRDIDRERDRERMDTSILNNISISENMNNSYIQSNSILNNSFVRNNDSSYNNANNNNINNTNYNLYEKMEDKQLTKFQEFLSGFNSNKNILLLVDGKGLIWEIIKRNDLDISRFSNEEYITSFSSILDKDKYKGQNKILENENFEEKFMNIEIKENEDKSFINSELDISKVSDMNISQLIKDSNYNNDTNENYIEN
jgi:hypothetical protein